MRLLLSIKEQHLRLVAGVPSGTQVDLSLIKLPEGSLIFPSPRGLNQTQAVEYAHTLLRGASPQAFPWSALPWLARSHEAVLLDAGIPVHVVADRCGHDPAVLLRSYAKRTKKADKTAADIIGSLSKAILE